MTIRYDDFDDKIRKTICSYVPANDAINTSLALPGLRLALGIDQAEQAMKDVFADNSYNPSKGKSSSRIGEGLAARLLYLVDRDMAVWGKLPEGLRIELIANARQNDYAECGKEATPDFVFLEQLTDVFTNHINVKQLVSNARDPVQAARNIFAEDGLLMSNAIEKWRLYGRHSIAVANITSFPAEISTTQVANALLLDRRWQNRHRTNRLFLLRHNTIIEVTASQDLD